MHEKWYAVAAVLMLVFTAVSVVEYLEVPRLVDPLLFNVISGAVGTLGFAQLYRQQRQNQSVQATKAPLRRN